MLEVDEKVCARYANALAYHKTVQIVAKNVSFNRLMKEINFCNVESLKFLNGGTKDFGNIFFHHMTTRKKGQGSIVQLFEFVITSLPQNVSPSLFVTRG